ncbi:MAG: GntR family transcriptional regulator [Hyphomicrobiales bacterium]
MASAVRDAIVAGDLIVDQRLPAEAELSDQFDVSRPTARKALLASLSDRRRYPQDFTSFLALAVAERTSIILRSHPLIAAFIAGQATTGQNYLTI